MKVTKQPKRSVSSIGIDIGSAEIRAVQLVGTSESFDVLRSSVFPRQSRDDASCKFDLSEAKYLRGVLERRGFVGSRVSICSPRGSTSTQVIDLPARDSHAPIDAIARAEFARSQRVSADSYEFASWYIPSRGRQDQGMVVACERIPLEQRIDAFEDAGMGVVGVDLEETAITRACVEQLDPRENAINAIVRLGWSSSLAVLALGNEVVYTRRIGLGVSRFILSLQDSNGLDLHDSMRMLAFQDSGVGSGQASIQAFMQAGWGNLAGEIANEVDTAVTYVAHAYRSAEIGKVALAGYGTGRAILREAFGSRVGMDAVVPVWPGVETPGNCAVSIGLARRFDG
ncbi:MAG: pilus assembly protein PilM [Phycisphaerales bacterium]